MSNGTGGDGNVPTAPDDDRQWTAMSRVLHLVKQSNGMTAIDLLDDPVLQRFGEGTIRRVPGALRDQGFLEAVGKRDRSTVWRAVDNPVPRPKTVNATLARKADLIIKNLNDERVRDAVKEGVASNRGVRQAGAALREAERELDAARLDQERRAADDERERLRMIEIARKQASQSIKTWDKLITEVRAAWTIIAAYSRDLDDLPAINPAFERLLDRELDELRDQLLWIDKRLHPGGHNPVQQGTVIDVG